ncbi:MAG: hypothetical protein RMI30_01350 [Thermodesulfovibrio sp.]|nr:hypothetical protein [Thermodesulfovibrio sp.]
MKEITGLESKKDRIQEDEILNLRINAEEVKSQRRYTPLAVIHGKETIKDM